MLNFFKRPPCAQVYPKCWHTLRLLLLFCLIFAKISYSSECKISKDKIKDLIWYEDKVEIIYFPSSPHTKIRVDDFIYGNECPGNRCAELPAKVLDRLGRISSLTSGSYFRFKIKVNNDELEALKKYIAEGHFGEGITCSHSACRALNKTTKIYIPFPLAITPLYNAIALAFARIIPGSRIVGIKFHFKKGSIPDMSSMILPEFMVGAIVMSGSYFIIYKGFLEVDKKKQTSEK